MAYVSIQVEKSAQLRKDNQGPKTIDMADLKTVTVPVDPTIVVGETHTENPHQRQPNREGIVPAWDSR